MKRCILHKINSGELYAATIDEEEQVLAGVVILRAAGCLVRSAGKNGLCL